MKLLPRLFLAIRYFTGGHCCSQQFKIRTHKFGKERRRNPFPVFSTFPDKQLFVGSIVQDVAVVLREHGLPEGVLVGNQGHVHRAVGIRNLAGRRTATLRVCCCGNSSKVKQKKTFLSTDQIERSDFRCIPVLPLVHLVCFGFRRKVRLGSKYLSAK